MPHCRHITQVSRIQPQNHLHQHSPPYFLLPMSFENYKVQVDSTATPSCTMTGTVKDQTSFQLIHREDTFISSSNHPSGSSSTTSIPVHHFSLQILHLLLSKIYLPYQSRTHPPISRVSWWNSSYEISSWEFAYGLACALVESAMRNRHTFVAEENYEDYMAQSPFHQAGNSQTMA